MNNKPNTRGGAGRGQGRKPLKYKKMPVWLYLQEDKVNFFGGRDGVKTLLEDYFERISEKKKKIV